MVWFGCEYLRNQYLELGVAPRAAAFRARSLWSSRMRLSPRWRSEETTIVRREEGCDRAVNVNTRR
jgi:hypothetical protein